MNVRKICFILGSTAFLFSVFPYILNVFLPVTPGRVNPLWDNWPYDFNYYRSIITEGKHERLTVVDKYTTEEQKGVFLRVGYLLVGHVSHVIHIDETTAYHVVRIILGIAFIYLIFRFLSIGLSSTTLCLMYFCALFIGSIPEYVCGETCRWIPSLWGMTQFDAIRRLTFIPHYQWGNIAFLISIMSFFVHSRFRNVLIALCGILLGLAGLDDPPSLILLYPVLFLTFVSLLWKKAVTRRFLSYAFLIMSFSLPFLVYIIFASNSFPWNLTRDIKIWLNTDVFGLTAAIGPVFCVGSIVGVYILLIKKKIPLFFQICASWIWVVLFLTFVGYKTGLFSQTRFLHSPIFIPAVVLAGYALDIFFRRYIPLVSKWKRIVIYGILVSIFIPSLFTFCFLYYDQIDYVIYFSKHTLSTIPYPNTIDYPPKSWMDGFTWLRKNTNPDDVVLSDYTAGNFIPTYGGNTVYYGHSVETFDSIRKKDEIIQFFSSDDSSFQEQFLSDNHIKYVFFGPQEKALRQTQLSLPSAILVFENDLVSIFKVVKQSF